MDVFGNQMNAMAFFPGKCLKYIDTNIAYGYKWFLDVFMFIFGV